MYLQKNIDEQSAGNLKVSEKAKLYAILVFLSLGYTCKLEITPVTGVRVGENWHLSLFVVLCPEENHLVLKMASSFL